MNKQDLETVRQGLDAVWQSQGREFVTFQPDGADADTGGPWVQYLDGELNLPWPLAEDPATALPRLGASLPAGAFVLFWTPEGAAQLGVGDLLVDDVARIVLSLFDRVLATSGRAPITSEVTRHG